MKRRRTLLRNAETRGFSAVVEEREETRISFFVVNKKA
jgi:hypothetical protein